VSGVAWWLVLEVAAITANLAMAAFYFRAWRRARRLNMVLTDCALRSFSMQHRATYRAWAQTLGEDIAIEIQLHRRGRKPPAD
jgi:uncharacterized membrane protein